eukprot:jgi/Tetstr1/461937/TSEL_007015.t1
MAEGGAESDPGVCGAAAMPDTRQDSARWHGALGGDGDLCFMEVAEEREATPGQPQDSEDPQKLVRWVSTLAPELQADLLLLCDLEGEAPPGDLPHMRDGPEKSPSMGRETAPAGTAVALGDSPFVSMQPAGATGSRPASRPAGVAHLDRLARHMPGLLGVRTWSQQMHDTELARIVAELKAEKRSGRPHASKSATKLHAMTSGAQDSPRPCQVNCDLEASLRNTERLGVRKVAALAFGSYMLGLDSIPTPDRMFHLGLFAALGSAMLLMNRSAMHYVADPTAVLLMQLGGAVLMVLAMKLQGVPIRLNPGWHEALAWALNAVGFLGSVFCSMETLRHSDPRWYTVLHYCEPLGVVLMNSMLDHKMRESQGLKPLLSLLALLAWAVCGRYWATGELLPSSPSAGVWGAAWLTVKTVYLTHLKHIVSISKVLPWERVLYANTFAFLILLAAIMLWNTLFNMSGPLESTTLVDLSRMTGESLGVVWASAICGTWLCLSRIVLLEQFSVREYALFSVIALAPARLMQTSPWHHTTP